MAQVKGRQALVLLLLLAPLLATPSHASQWAVRPVQINLNRFDTLRITYTSTRQVATVLQKPPAGLVLFTSERSDSSRFEGTIDLSPENTTEGIHQYSPAFYSSVAYALAVMVLRFNETTYYVREMAGTPHQAVKTLSLVKEPVAEYWCPANVTVQVNLSIQILGPSSQTTATAQPGAFATLPSVPEWEIGLYAATLTPFLGIALLNIRDLRRARKVIWTARYSAAVLIRHLFYGLILSFFLACAVFLALLIGGAILGVLPNPRQVSTWTLLVSALPIIPTAIAYGLARRNGWYDILDEAL